VTRRLAAALLAVLAASTPVAAQEGPAENVVRVDVRAMSTVLVPNVTERLVIRARAVNTGTEPLRRLRVQLRFGEKLKGRSAVAADPTGRFVSRAGDTVLGDGELAAGATGEVEFDVDVTDLPFRHSRDAGVYPMRIEVRQLGLGVVGSADTYVMWWPATGPKVRVAWVWPLVEPSHRRLGNDFFDDELAGSVTDGRLDTLLALGAASRVPVTWAVDPELLDALHRMTGPYTVLGREGGGTAAARAWLDRVKRATQNATVLPLPYADPDLATTATATLAPDAGRAFQLGREVLRRDLGNAGNARLAWPPGTTLDPAVEALLSGQGVKGVVVPEAALPLTGDPLYFTQTAPAPLASGALGSMTALVADAQLNGFVAHPEREAGPRLAAQRFLADTAMIALERPTDLRDVVVTPPRTWEPPVRDFAAQLLEQSASAPWVQAVGLDTVLGDEPSATPRSRAPGGRGVLPADHVRRVLDAKRLLQRVRAILTDPKRAPAELADLDDALLRAVSAEWSGDPHGQRLTDTVTATVRTQLGRLRVVAGGTVVMTGRSGKIPLTFQNDLGQAVRVKVRLDSGHRLELDSNTAYERGREVVIPPGASTLVIEGRATTGGRFPLKVDLRTPDGAPLGTGTTVYVRSTAYGVVALAVTGAAFGLLLVASATRLLRRRRSAPPDAA
jgi:hypothetical protein